MRDFLQKHKNVIFSSVTAGLTIASLVTMNKAAINYHISEDNSIQNKVKHYWKPAILGALSITGSIYTGIEADHINSLYLAAIAYINEYRSRVVETYGTSADQQIQNRIPKSIRKIGFEDLTFQVDDEETRLFYITYPKDEFSGEIIGRYFHSTLQNVLNAQYMINMDYAKTGKAYMVDLFHYLDMELNRVNGGYDDRGWNMIEDGYLWIEFVNYVERMDDGSEICRVDIKTVPTEVIDQ